MKKLLFLLTIICGCSNTHPQTIHPSQLRQDALILDVRTDGEHEEIALLRNHWQVPLDELDAEAFVREHKLDGIKPLYLLCRSGKRAEVAAEKFRQAGHTNVVVIQGGIIEAEKAGLEIKRGQR